LKGTYTLIILCTSEYGAKIGSLGYSTVRKGYYLYTGSAQGKGSVSLEGRLSRHLRGSKNVTWHVDYLTSNPRCRVRAIVCLESSKRLECDINQEVIRNLGAKPILSRAGSSDCKCNGHLTKIGPSIGAGTILSRVTVVYRRFGGAVRCMQFANHARKNTAQLNLVECP
jgi:Uri superfamily endonuclease